MSYGETVRDKGISDRTLSERAAMYLPGYRGYRNKNVRREVDKEVRREVVRAITACKTEISGIQKNIISRAGIEVVKECDRIRTKIDTYIKRIESAESGYSALWDTIRTLEDELDTVIAWDAKLLEEGAELRKMTKRLVEDTDNGKIDISADLRKIERKMDDMNDGLNERIKTIKGLAE